MKHKHGLITFIFEIIIVVFSLKNPDGPVAERHKSQDLTESG